MRGATQYGVPLEQLTDISIHAPHAGCDGGNAVDIMAALHFNPRTPCGVRLPFTLISMSSSTFQSTHPMRGATKHFGDNARPFCISIHAPHAGCDYTPPFLLFLKGIFQSTHPMRGATAKNRLSGRSNRNFNPRTPCGVRPAHLIQLPLRRFISIHAPHAGCDGSLLT